LDSISNGQLSGTSRVGALVLAGRRGRRPLHGVQLCRSSGTPRATSPTWGSAVPFDGLLSKDGLTVVQCEIVCTLYLL
ncbi:MAG: hypothetical protein FWB93_02310, partial [Oscillospiraceae bacterium]|nr:hypothetical protein [Oscillospiraceae bacterium]